jgi:hypothetical protein
MVVNAYNSSTRVAQAGESCFETSMDNIARLSEQKIKKPKTNKKLLNHPGK